MLTAAVLTPCFTNVSVKKGYVSERFSLRLCETIPVSIPLRPVNMEVKEGCVGTSLGYALRKIAPSLAILSRFGEVFL